MEQEKVIDTKTNSPEEAGAIIEIRSLAKSFGDNEVLRDINFDLKKGENLVILGKSGTGKSVTIKCIVGLLTQDKGSIKVLNEDVAALGEEALKALRVRIGFLFQGAALYDSMTVRENLEFPLRRVLKIRDKKELNGRVEKILEGVGLPDAVDKMPSDLSGGMRKRIGLARTMILKPEIMLYDEPTTGLDPITSKEISELIQSMKENYGVSSIIITHDLPCARITADRMLVMDEGVIVAEGTYDELERSKNKFINAFFK